MSSRHGNAQCLVQLGDEMLTALFVANLPTKKILHERSFKSLSRKFYPQTYVLVPKMSYLIECLYVICADAGSDEPFRFLFICKLKQNRAKFLDEIPGTTNSAALAVSRIILSAVKLSWSVANAFCVH